MKLSCIQENLKRGLATVGRAVAGKSPLPVLSNILLATDNGRLKLAATDLEIGITCWIEAEVEEEGAITLPARLFGDIVGNLPNDHVRLSLDARTQTITLECGRFTNNLKGIEADDFPPIPTATDQESMMRVPAPALRHCIEQIAFAASNDESRPVLTGVLVRMHPNNQTGGSTATFAAADGYRLATRAISLPEGALDAGEDMSEFIIPARALSELSRVIGDSAEEVHMSVTPGGAQMFFSLDSVALNTRLLDGKFPDFERIIPAEYTTRSLIDTQELMKAVKLASFFATNNQNFVKLSVEPGDESAPGKVTISANAAEIGDNKGELDATIEGEGGQLAMNVKFLNEALAVMGTSQIALEMQTSQNPGVLKPVGETEYVHIIMPMTLR